MASAELLVVGRLRGQRWMSLVGWLAWIIPARWRIPAACWATSRVRFDLRTESGRLLRRIRFAARWDDETDELIVTPQSEAI